MSTCSPRAAQCRWQRQEGDSSWGKEEPTVDPMARQLLRGARVQVSISPTRPAGTHISRQLRCQRGHLLLRGLQLATQLADLLQGESRGVRGAGCSHWLWGGQVAALGRGSPQTASSPQPGSVRAERDRQRQAVRRAARRRQAQHGTEDMHGAPPHSSASFFPTRAPPAHSHAMRRRSPAAALTEE